MDEAKQGRKLQTEDPDSEAPLGKQEPGADPSEAGGRRKLMLYTCFNDGAGNYVEDCGCGRFTCWRCGVMNLI